VRIIHVIVFLSCYWRKSISYRNASTSRRADHFDAWTVYAIEFSPRRTNVNSLKRSIPSHASIASRITGACIVSRSLHMSTVSDALRQNRLKVTLKIDLIATRTKCPSNSVSLRLLENYCRKNIFLVRMFLPKNSKLAA